MGIHVEPIIFQIRGGEQFVIYGDPYDWACMGIKIDDDTIKIVGAAGKMGMKDVREAIMEIKAKFKFKNVIWERKKNNREKEVRV